MIALFPGKFQPPHVGHIITVVRIYDEYKKIIVGVTEDGPIVMAQNDRVEMLRELFKYMDKVSVIPLSGVLSEYEDSSLLPMFDICLSGNQKVVEKIRSFGMMAEHIDRSKGIGFSGTEIRTLV
jgi:nicotinamide mononucleotide adenylyltransferase